MARFFNEQEIDGFRDCFYLNCKSGLINDVDQLQFVMRSVGFSPTLDELKQYLQMRNNSIKFADFLDCAHAQSQAEKIPDEILRAFRVSPFVKRDIIKLQDLRHIICNWGEKSSQHEFQELLAELKLQGRQDIHYKEFVESLVIHKTDRENGRKD